MSAVTKKAKTTNATPPRQGAPMTTQEAFRVFENMAKDFEKAKKRVYEDIAHGARRGRNDPV